VKLMVFPRATIAACAMLPASTERAARCTV